MKPGDRIEWTYWHSLNHRSGLCRVKYGRIIRYVKHRVYNFHPQMAVVRFDYNKSDSRIPIIDLRRESTDAT